MLDYNSRLKPLAQKGLCGDPEKYESERSLEQKVSKLASLIRDSSHCVVFTGAGISTNSGIPDFRGPNGVWTKEKKGLQLSPEECTSALFDQALPSLTHQAIATLVDLNKVHHVISQNVDGLHLRSGVPPSLISELHGNIYIEICDSCGTHYFRAHDVGGMGFQPTGNKCEDPNCGASPLRDFAVDWDTELPHKIFATARAHLRKADLCICLGTSLRIRPAGNMPLTVLRKTVARPHPGKLVAINLQKTHVDKHCSVRIFHDCDTVMQMVCEKLSIFVSPSSAQLVLPSFHWKLGTPVVHAPSRVLDEETTEGADESSSGTSISVKPNGEAQSLKRTFEAMSSISES